MARILGPLRERKQPGAEHRPQHSHSSKVCEKVVYRGKIYICPQVCESSAAVIVDASGQKLLRDFDMKIRIAVEITFIKELPGTS